MMTSHSNERNQRSGEDVCSELTLTAGNSVATHWILKSMWPITDSQTEKNIMRWVERLWVKEKICFKVQMKPPESRAVCFTQAPVTTSSNETTQWKTMWVVNVYVGTSNYDPSELAHFSHISRSQHINSWFQQVPNHSAVVGLYSTGVTKTQLQTIAQNNDISWQK